MRSLGGPSAALRSAALGAVLLALIEGIGIGITRMTAEQFKPVMPQPPDPAQLPPKPFNPTPQPIQPASEFDYQPQYQ